MTTQPELTFEHCDPGTLSVLEAAGWRPGRMVDFSRFESVNSSCGGEIVQPARRVLASLAGLVLKPTEGSSYAIADETAASIGGYMDVVLATAAPDLARRTTPLAENSGSRLFMDSEGWLWLHVLDVSLLLFGYEFESGVANLLRPKSAPGRKIREISLPQYLNGPD